jgi:AraC-like DNA-binding protein
MTRYLELAPREDLAGIAACVWIFESAAEEAQVQRIVPDGRPELIVHLARPYAEVTANGGLTERSSPLFAGQMTLPLHLKALGPVRLIALRFEPAGARRFAGAPMDRLTDARLPLAELHGAAAALGLLEALRAAPSEGAAIEALQDYVAGCLGPPSPDQDAVAACVESLLGSEGRVTLDELLALSGLSARTLERRFRDIVGVSPRLLRSIVRFRRVFDALAEDPGQGFTGAAMAAGYFDHPQMARDFRRFVGCTPSQYLSSAPGLSRSLAQIDARDGNLQAPVVPAG